MVTIEPRKRLGTVIPQGGRATFYHIDCLLGETHLAPEPVSVGRQKQQQKRPYT